MNDLQTSDLSVAVGDFIGKQKDHFTDLNKTCPNQLDFQVEAEFALQILNNNDYLLGIGRTNPDSLKAAIANVAAIGITLNPALAFAYLVPRKGAICLDISYRGLLKLATDTGIVSSMKAELVYENDDFQYRGFHEKPLYSGNPFKDRGALIGVYAMANLADGSVLVEIMSMDEVNKIRDDSEAYKSAKKAGGYKLDNNVWVKYYGEMVKKTAIKRCYKTLPTSKGMELVGKAIEVINEIEGIEFQEPEYQSQHTEEELLEYQRCVNDQDYFNLYTLINTLCAEAQLDLRKICVPEAPKGMKGKATAQWKKDLSEAEMEVSAALALLIERLDEGDDSGALEILSECSQWTINYFEDRMTPEQEIMLNQLPREGTE